MAPNGDAETPGCLDGTGEFLSVDTLQFSWVIQGVHEDAVEAAPQNTWDLRFDDLPGPTRVANVDEETIGPVAVPVEQHAGVANAGEVFSVV
jgi:hypothetical protein